MCLLVIAFRSHPDFPLIIAGNRDEFHDRPTRDAHWWPDHPDLLAGRDLLAGGSWLALHRSGRFAAVTNYRDADSVVPKLRSRGHLVREFANSPSKPSTYVSKIDPEQYAGFNLLCGTRDELAYLSNRSAGARTLGPSVYGLSNATLDTPWEKVERSKAALRRLIDANNVNETTLMRLLGDRDKGPVSEVEQGRLPFAMAHAITAPFIVLPDYGTRCSTVVITDREGHWRFVERRFDASGHVTGESEFSFRAAENGG